MLRYGKQFMIKDLGTDLLVTNRKQQPVLAVEIKKNVGVTTEWAIKLRRNLLTHGFYYTSPFFLLVTPDKFFLWKNQPANFDLIKPDYIIDAKPILEKYILSTGLTIDEINSREFELIVSAWIGDLLSIQDLEDFPDWMTESGLAEAMKEGFYEQEYV